MSAAALLVLMGLGLIVVAWNLATHRARAHEAERLHRAWQRHGGGES